MAVIRTKSALSIPYVWPGSGIFQVTAKSVPLATNVIVIGRWQLEDYRARKDIKPLKESHLYNSHEFMFELTPGIPWNLLIENPWSQDVEVNWSVVEMRKV